MKKILTIVLTICILLTLGAVHTLAAIDSDYRAQYATSAPTIDGEIDEVWSTAEAINTYEFPGFAHGYAKILWTEDTLYLLAEVFDETVDVGENNSSNQACFWVSEIDSGNPSYSSSCDWNISINQSGVFEYYSGVNMQNRITYVAALSDNGYVVEIAIPVQTAGYLYSEGAKIGFCLSIEDDVDGDDERDSVTATQPENYWSSVENLYSVTLMGGPVSGPDSDSPSEDGNVSDGQKPVQTGKIVTVVVIALAVCVGVGAVVLVLVKKAKKKED